MTHNKKALKTFWLTFLFISMLVFIFSWANSKLGIVGYVYSLVDSLLSTLGMSDPQAVNGEADDSIKKSKEFLDLLFGLSIAFAGAYVAIVLGKVAITISENEYISQETSIRTAIAENYRTTYTQFERSFIELLWAFKWLSLATYQHRVTGNIEKATVTIDKRIDTETKTDSNQNRAKISHDNAPNTNPLAAGAIKKFKSDEATMTSVILFTMSCLAELK